ncbi:uncharacterized protein B0I36DRAFT_356168 [Microdochium trichocladiopsis]|uniref:Uncharacterized protein n=1 Tax=Microdochium trichocladiopsis TaxID=1682393 RepID=A0A9P8XQE2_9PEZI|nr:uncharacterized protein B0I36DRAFT_356168 [Microdochium trichocladiopsis]KAH7012070.1 hypothetical protein B0I36DRAFT_356168 [Microdochium trichocladiopsis]
MHYTSTVWQPGSIAKRPGCTQLNNGTGTGLCDAMHYLPIPGPIFHVDAMLRQTLCATNANSMPLYTCGGCVCSQQSFLTGRRTLKVVQDGRRGMQPAHASCTAAELEVTDRGPQGLHGRTMSTYAFHFILALKTTSYLKLHSASHVHETRNTAMAQAQEDSAQM